MGGRSRAAAQLLAGNGFEEVYNLKGGIKAWQGYTAAGPIEAGMVYLRGDETAADIVILAYSMETGLGSFYLNVAETVEKPPIKDVLKGLAEIEERHKDRLFNLYCTMDSSAPDRAVFESKILPGVMEGGFTTEEFLKQNQDALQSEADVVNVAMMLETQALDLYLRYSHKTKDQKGHSVLSDLAEEEKNHLDLLGNLLETHALWKDK